MSALQFSIQSASHRPYSASPTVRFALQIRNETWNAESVEAALLRTQIRIEPQWRSYEADEQAQLRDLFSTPDRWEKTMHALAWADVPVMVPAFDRETVVEVHIPCTYDFDVSATRFFSALGEGDIPLRFLFSGSVFRNGENGFFVEPIPWSSECAYRMPLDVWRSAMKAFYGDSVLIRIDRETFNDLHRRRIETGAIDWDTLVRGAP